MHASIRKTVQTLSALGRQCASSFLAGALLVVLTIGLGLCAARAAAQTAGEAALQGTVTDPTGAVIPNATVTATDNATGVATSRTTTAGGFYVISPLSPGNYTVTVDAQGFSQFKQLNVTLNAMQTFGLNIALKLASTSANVTVTTAPPELQTTSATLGGSIDSKVYLELPILINNQQRDITAFSNLLPGAQPGARSSLFSGTQSRVEEVYLDGIPITTISQIGDNRPVFNVVPPEAVDQINVVTSSASAEYQGAGMVNYTTKSGGNQYHGTVADFVRNTAFDTWGFTAITATKTKVVNGQIVSVPAGKPADHQNELTFSVGGPISIPHLFSGHDKLFFFGSYDRFHSRSAANPSQTTIPTMKMRTGDFSELLASNGGPGYVIYDPTTQAQCTANSTTGPCRYAYGQTYAGTPGPAGNPSGTPTNIIPAGEISPIAKYMEQWLPTPTLSGPGIISGNYLGGSPTGYDNWLYSGRIDYNLSDKQRISWIIAGGNRVAWPFTSTANLQLPIPYTQSDYSVVAGHWSDLEDSYTFTPHLVNQFRFGWSNFGGPPLKNLTEGIKQYEAVTAGITFSGVPSNGQAPTEFPTSVFSGSNAPEQWGDGGSGQTSTIVTESYTTVDNLLWVKGNHSMTFGFQMQRLEDNTSSYDGPASSLTLNWSPNETACIVPGGKGSTCTAPVAGSGYQYLTNTGYSYASFMLGAVDSTGISLQPFSVLGGRYSTYSPYFQDDWKATSRLTLNLGLRWDYISPYHEVLDRFSYLNPTLTNPITGTPGTLEFAGTWGGPGVSCNCSTPVHTYWKNWGPHVGFAYELNHKTVVRGGFATLYSHGGGTGGASGAGTGPTQMGFTSSVSFPANAAGPGAGPVFYLNNNTSFVASNANFGGPGYSVPAITPPGAISQTLNVGNTVDSNGNYIKAGGAPTFADFYVSGRAPEFNFWNFGFDREISNNITISIDYAGSESHFLYGASNIRGLYAGQVNPIYYALGSLLNAPATAANVAKAQAIIPSITVPYAGFEAAAATSAGSGQATIGRMLTWKPQFSGTSDTWGSSTANASYHSLQISAHKRLSSGLDITANYTYSKQIDDAGTQRDGFAIPASTTLNGKAWAQNRIDRAISATSVPQNLAVYGTYKMPFGEGRFGGASNALVRQIIKGWQLGGTFTYASGTPLLVTSSNCVAPFSGTCMPDVNPNFTGKTIRENGSWGKGITAKNFSAIHYLVNPQDGSCTPGSCPFSDPQNYMFGDAARTMAYDGLRNPSAYSLNGSVNRTFDISERWKFVFRADCQNIPNKVTFGGIATNMDNTNFGTVSSATGNTGSRDFQFSGRINF
jgi:hypothetical protein